MTTEVYPVTHSARMPTGETFTATCDRPQDVTRFTRHVRTTWAEARSRRAILRTNAADLLAPLSTTIAPGETVTTFATDTRDPTNPDALADLNRRRVRGETVTHYHDGHDWHTLERLPSGTYVIDGARYPRLQARSRALAMLGTADHSHARLASTLENPEQGLSGAQLLAAHADLDRLAWQRDRLARIVASMPDPREAARQRVKTRDRVRAYRAGVGAGISTGRVDVGSYSTARISPPRVPRLTDGPASPVTDVQGFDISRELAARRAEASQLRRASLTAMGGPAERNLAGGLGSRKAQRATDRKVAKLAA